MPVSAIALLGAMLAASPIALPERIVAPDGSTPSLRYNGSVQIVMQQAGHDLPNRSGVQHCSWKSILSVHRNIASASAAGNAGTNLSPVAEQVIDRGSKPGACAAWKQSLEADAARKLDVAAQHMAQLVETDRARLANELAALAATNTGSMD